MDDAMKLVSAGIFTEEEVIHMCEEAMKDDDEAKMLALTQIFSLCAEMLINKKEKEIEEVLNKFKNEDR